MTSSIWARRVVMPCLVVTAVAASVALSRSSSAQQPTLDEVLTRLGTYLLVYEERLSTLVAEEQYEQVFRIPTAVRGRPTRRTLTSDYVLVRLPGVQAWLGFRDTFLVDKIPVRNHDARLERLLSEAPEDAIEQAQRIVDENARYNLGDDAIRRTINAPTLTLDLMHPRYRTRFSFRRNGLESIDGRQLWRIGFVERAQPPIITTPAGADQITRGTAWVDPGTGAVVRTYLEVVISGDSRARITVDYRHDSTLGLLVPSHMRESYRQHRTTIDAIATYSKFRQFQTSARVIEK